MQNVFLEVVKLSLTGSLFAAAVMLVRLFFRKAPKWLFCVLWGAVALRLICPVSVESNVSLVPDNLASGQIIANVGNAYIGEVDILYESNTGYDHAVEAGREPVYSKDGNYVVTEKNSLEAPKTVGETVFPILSWVWAAGMVLMLAYTAASYLVLRKKMEEATHLRGNIWQCEQADSPFVLGFLKPRIYLPYTVTDSDMENVIAHEQAHIGRKDHWWKPIGFLLLSIHWFNPVLWLAYVLLCRDIEGACDEKVIKNMEKDQVRAYSTALLNCSVHRRRIAACPLAFGEVGVKERIKHVMRYKKPALGIIILVVAASMLASVLLLTNPATENSLIRKIVNQKGYTIINQQSEMITLSLPMSSLPEKIFSETGVEFPTGEIIAYQDETASIYLKSAQLSNEGPEKLYFCFDILFNLPKDGGKTVYPFSVKEKGLADAVRETDGIIRADNQDFVSAVSARGQGSFEKMWFYISANALGKAEGHIEFDIQLNTLSYLKEGKNYEEVFGQEESREKLISIVDEIVYNPNCAASSNPFTYIDARKPKYNEILTYGEDAVELFVQQIRVGENGLREYIMAVACADITGIGDKFDGADWATAQQWLSLYDSSEHEIIVPKLIAEDYISGRQAKFQSFGHSLSKGGEEPLAAGVSLWMAAYSDDETLMLDGKNGQNQILLAPQGFSLHHYKIYLPDGTLYDDGTRTLYDSLSPMVLPSEQGICLIAPPEEGEYYYELELAWPEKDLAVSYGLKIVMTGAESDYDRALESIFAKYGEGNPLISASLVDRYVLANAVYSSKRYVFRIENIPNAPIWVEVAGENGEITGEYKQYDVLPPYVDAPWGSFDSGPAETVHGNRKTYYRNTDGTWQADGRNYKYRLEITGRMPNAAVDSTFVYLSNLETITFDQAWKAAGLSSSMSDYFKAEDAVLVEWLNGGPKAMTLADVIELSRLGMKLTWEDLKVYKGMDIGSGLHVAKFDIDPEFYLLVGDGKTTGEPMYAYLNAISNGASCDIRESDVEAFIKENQSDALDYAIHKAVIEHNADGTFPDFPNGFIPTQVHYIYGIETKSGTPLAGQVNHVEKITVYVHYVYGRYVYSNGEISKVAGTANPAKITFSVDPEKGYILKEFWEPNDGSTFGEEIRDHFPKDIADIVLDPQSDTVDTEKMERASLVKVQEYISGLAD